jgi:hypothetical protein
MYNDVYDMCTTESGAVPDEGAAPRTRKKKKLLRASKTSLCKTIEMGNSIAQVNCEPGSNSVTANGWLLQIHADSPPMAGFCMAFGNFCRYNALGNGKTKKHRKWRIIIVHAIVIGCHNCLHLDQ